MQQEVACHHILSCRGRELLLYRDVQVTSQDGLEQRLLLEVGDEFACGLVLLLRQIVAVWLVGLVVYARCQSLVSEAFVGPPYLVGVEWHVHAKHDGEPALHFATKEFHLLRGDCTIYVVQADEVDPVDLLCIE